MGPNFAHSPSRIFPTPSLIHKEELRPLKTKYSLIRSFTQSSSQELLVPTGMLAWSEVLMAVLCLTLLLLLLKWARSPFRGCSPSRRWGYCQHTHALGTTHHHHLLQQVSSMHCWANTSTQVLLGPPKDPPAGASGSALRRHSSKITAAPLL